MRQNHAPAHLVYFVHDLGDPAVARRLAMLQPYLASAVIIGFHRRLPVPDSVAGWPAISLGCTADGRLKARAFSVLRNLALIRRLKRHLAGADFVMARQLEMLAIAGAARRLYAKQAVLAYECLDIHRAMTGNSVMSRMLRGAEARLLRGTDFVIISSLAFLEGYLLPAHGVNLPPACLIENKVLRGEMDAGAGAPARPDGPPWRIGWYGALRCRHSLALLIELTRRLPGQVVVELRGRPARAAIPDFDALVAAAPGVEFLGPYDRHRDLARIYQSVHFTWAIDFYEAGLNSAWLLPNRLYEGGLHGAVPLAAAGVATGAWLHAQQAGVLLGEDLAQDLARYFAELTAPGYAAAAAALAAVPVACWADDGADGERLMAQVKQARTSFFEKKEAKKLLLRAAGGF